MQKSHILIGNLLELNIFRVNMMNWTQDLQEKNDLMHQLIKLAINNVTKNKNNLSESFKHDVKEKALTKLQYNKMKM